MQKRAIAESLPKLKAEALSLWEEGEEIRTQVLSGLQRSLDRAWRFGKVLVRIKAIVGAGNWQLWVESNMPEGCGLRNAQRFMALHVENPSAKSVGDLSEDSVRKFRLGYVPAKERPELLGDQVLPPVAHHLTVLNNWRKFVRQVEIQHAQLDQEEARRDLRPMYDWLRKLYE